MGCIREAKAELEYFVRKQQWAWHGISNTTAVVVVRSTARARARRSAAHAEIYTWYCIFFVFFQCFPPHGWNLKTKTKKNPSKPMMRGQKNCLCKHHRAEQILAPRPGSILLNPISTAVPFGGQTTCNLSGLFPKRDCSPKGVKQ